MLGIPVVDAVCCYELLLCGHCRMFRSLLWSFFWADAAECFVRCYLFVAMDFCCADAAGCCSLLWTFVAPTLQDVSFVAMDLFALTLQDVLAVVNCALIFFLNSFRPSFPICNRIFR